MTSSSATSLASMSILPERTANTIRSPSAGRSSERRCDSDVVRGATTAASLSSTSSRSRRSNRGRGLHDFFTSHRDAHALMARSVAVLMFIGALTLLIAAAVHGGLFGAIDPFAGAALPEAILGVVLAAAAITAL